jgi:hypothetical protein
MIRGHRVNSHADRSDRRHGPAVAGYGLGTGVVSGFFGIGGGFLIVPGLMAATRMPISARWEPAF